MLALCLSPSHLLPPWARHLMVSLPRRCYWSIPFPSLPLKCHRPSSHFSSRALSPFGVSVPIRVSQSCNYSSSSHDDSLPLHHHLPQLAVSRCFICFTRLSQRRRFASPFIRRVLTLLSCFGGVESPHFCPCLEAQRCATTIIVLSCGCCFAASSCYRLQALPLSARKSIHPNKVISQSFKP